MTNSPEHSALKKLLSDAMKQSTGYNMDVPIVRLAFELTEAFKDCPVLEEAAKNNPKLAKLLARAKSPMGTARPKKKKRRPKST